MGARGRTTADGSVVLNLHRGAGAYALLARTDGQLTRAGQHYYSHLGLRPPTKDFDYNQPLIREGPNDYILLRNGQKKLVRSLEGDGERRLTKLGKAFFRDKCYEYLVHVPVVIRGRRRSGRGLRAERLATDQRARGRHDSAPRGTHRGVAQRVRRGVEASLGDPAGPILQLSDETYYLDPEGRWVVSTPELADGGGDAAAAAHAGAAKRELPAALRGGRAGQCLRTSRSAWPGSLRSCCSLASRRSVRTSTPCSATIGGAWASRRSGSSASGATPLCGS